MEKQLLAERKTKSIYREGNKVIKRFNENYSKADVLNEALNQARVEETDLKIAKILGVTTINGEWSIELEYVPGDTLQQLMDKNPDKMDEYLEKMVDIQIEMHKQKCPRLGKLKDKYRRKLEQVVIDPSSKFDLYTKLDSMPKHTKLCHGDFNPSNIIVMEDGTPVILDWSHATQGNASSDAAYAYLDFLLKGEEKIGRKYLKLYCQKTNTALQYVQRWISLVSAVKLLKANDKEKEILMKFIQVVEY